jgi:predicted esterase
VGQRLGEVLDACCSSDADAAVGPVLMVHGDADESLPPFLSAELVEELCDAGVAVQYRTYPGAGHDGVLAAAADDAARWLTDRLAGADPPADCAES